MNKRELFAAVPAGLSALFLAPLTTATASDRLIQINDKEAVGVGQIAKLEAVISDVDADVEGKHIRLGVRDKYNWLIVTARDGREIHSELLYQDDVFSLRNKILTAANNPLEIAQGCLRLGS